ncbi:MAG: glucose-6-phosphate dehydrogenase [Brevirhabdus sp.]
MASRVIPVDPFDLVIFGGTGDLARRKILPALYHRFNAEQITDEARIIGAARSDLDDGAYRAEIDAALREFLDPSEYDPDRAARFLDLLSYIKVDARGDEGWADLKSRMRPGVVHAFYFSVGPSLFGDLAERLHGHGITHDRSRIVVEKPFGHDLETACALNAVLVRNFTESQIYRIDHYLGKETVQNLMAVRFGNILFEPLWNAQYVDHVQITVSETVGVAGRGAYYDYAGAMRDMVQNHLMQLLCLIAMEPPAQFNPDAVRDEKLKVIRALDPVGRDEIVRGQYGGTDKLGDYRSDVENPDSTTESFISMKLHLSNWRWKGTPFYVRTGKRMKQRMSEIVVVFKPLPHNIFGSDVPKKPNALTIRLQPDEGITLNVTIKEPGPGGMRLIEVPLDMTFAEALRTSGHEVHDAYERLIMDVIRGNQTLFMRGDEVEAAWAWTDPIIEGWESRQDDPLPYESGSNGPEEAAMLMHRDDRRWRDLEGR